MRHRGVAQHHLVDAAIDLPVLLGRDRAGEIEIETEPVGRHEAALLVRLLAKDVLEGAMEQMGRAVVAHDRLAALGVDLRTDLAAHPQRTLDEATVVGDQARHRALGIGDLESPLVVADQPRIADLAARLRVERRRRQDERRLARAVDRAHARPPACRPPAGRGSRCCRSSRRTR